MEALYARDSANASKERDRYLSKHKRITIHTDVDLTTTKDVDFERPGIPVYKGSLDTPDMVAKYGLMAPHFNTQIRHEFWDNETKFNVASHLQNTNANSAWVSTTADHDAARHYARLRAEQEGKDTYVYKIAGTGAFDARDSRYSSRAVSNQELIIPAYVAPTHIISVETVNGPEIKLRMPARHGAKPHHDAPQDERSAE